MPSEWYDRCCAPCPAQGVHVQSPFLHRKITGVTHRLYETESDLIKPGHPSSGKIIKQHKTVLSGELYLLYAFLGSLPAATLSPCPIFLSQRD